jgi:hypothetical protein
MALIDVLSDSAGRAPMIINGPRTMIILLGERSFGSLVDGV